MISAGQTPYPTQGTQPTNPYSGSGYYGQPPAGQQPVGAGMSAPPAFTPVTLPSSPLTPQGGPTTNINWTPTNDKFMEGYMWGQFGLQAGGMINGLANMLCNYGLASKAMDCQLEIANKYYDVQDNIASYQMEVALSQIEVQGEAIDAQTTMHAEQCRHEEKMAKLSGTTQARLAAIAEKGKTDRAKIFAVTDAFSRSGWDMGSPAIAA